MRKILIIVAVAAMTFMPVVSAQTAASAKDGETRTGDSGVTNVVMPFDKCVQKVKNLMFRRSGVEVIVDTPMMYLVKFSQRGEWVSVSCSRMDSTITVTTRDKS